MEDIREKRNGKLYLLGVRMGKKGRRLIPVTYRKQHHHHNAERERMKESSHTTQQR